MMQATRERTAKEKTIGVALQASANGHSPKATQVYIPSWVGVKGLDREIVIEDCYDVDEAVKAISKYRKQNVLLLIRYTDGSRVITCCDMKTDRILASWTDDLPLAIKTEVRYYCLECGREFVAHDGEQTCPECSMVACEHCSEFVERDEAVFSRWGEVFCYRCADGLGVGA